MKTESETIGLVNSRSSSAASEKHLTKVYLVSYAAHALEKDSINIAVIMIGDDFTDVRFACDWQRVLTQDPEADIQLLTALRSEIQEKMRVPDQREEMLVRMEDSWSNTLRLTRGKDCLTADPAAQLERLASLDL